MTGCEICLQETKTAYLIEVTPTDKCHGSWLRLLGAAPCSIWVCSQCDYMLSMMASFGWFELSRIKASVSSDIRLIRSVEIWK